MSMLRTLLSVLASLLLSTLCSASDELVLSARLERLAQSLEAARLDAHVPGMTIAVVQDDKVVWVQGFGLADVAKQTAADEHTLYAIGSTTKAFTATLGAMQVDAGTAEWDDPLTKFLPYFELAVRSDDLQAQCTLRDLLSHRSGFSRMGVLVIGGQASREEILRTAAGAEPMDGLRDGFHYSNVMYLAAGEALGVAGGSSWDELIARQLFVPLGMKSSRTSLARARENGALSVGYTWFEADALLEPQQTLDLGSIAPAGGIYSTAPDMAQWLRLQLGRGQIDGRRIVSERNLLETWEPQIEMGDGRSYGMGWMLGEHAGSRLIEHGGNVDGFTAQVALMPDEDLGFVLLMNLNAAPLRRASLDLVFGALLEKEPTPATAEASSAADELEPQITAPVDLDELAGTYVANFDSFRDELFEVSSDDGVLFLDIPSQQRFELKEPDGGGKWHFQAASQVAIVFERGDKGAIVGLTLHQGGFSFAVPRRGVKQPLEASVEQLEKYLGYYRMKGGRRNVQVTLVAGGLVFDSGKEQMPLHVPDAQGNAPMRARADYGVTFQLDAGGAVESLVLHTSRDRTFLRQSATQNADLPSLADVLALRNVPERLAALADSGGARASGEVWVPQAGVRGTITFHVRGQHSYASELDFGKFGRVLSTAHEGRAWKCVPLRGTRELLGDELTQALLAHPSALDGDWNAYFDSIEVLRNELLNDRPTHVLLLKRGTLPSYTYWVDAENGDVLQVNMIAIENGVRVPVTSTHSAFKLVNGVRTATRVELTNPASGRTVIHFTNFEHGLSLPDELFVLEAD